MSLTRRRFIESASLTLVAATARPIVFAQRISSPSRGPFGDGDVDFLDGISEETFKPLIGDSFVVLQGNRKLESLTLISLTPVATPSPKSNLPSGGRPGRPFEQAVNCFSVRFQTSGMSLPQGTYTLKHASLGSFPLFIVPGGSGMNPHTYTATFNRLAP